MTRAASGVGGQVFLTPEAVSWFARVRTGGWSLRSHDRTRVERGNGLSLEMLDFAGLLLILAALDLGVGLATRGRRAAPPPADDAQPGGNDPAADAIVSTFVFYSYYGYGFRPGFRPRDLLPPARVAIMTAPDGATDWLDTPADPLGFWSRYPLPLNPPDDDTLVVGLLGGSVAQWLGLQCGSRIEQALSARFAGRPVRLVDFGVGGFKQPQQVAVLAHMLALGQSFDAVVNLDGYNEAVYGDMNLTQGTRAETPCPIVVKPLRAAVSASGSSARGVILSGRVLDMEARVTELGHRIDRSRSMTMSLLRMVRESHLRARLARARRALRELPGDPDSDLICLPPSTGTDSDASVIDLWVAGSIQLHRLCRANGIGYLHVLQPTPFVGGRAWSDDERRTISRDTGHGDVIARIYEGFRTASAGLLEEGVRFLDATTCLDAVAETVFADTYGHLNQRGNDVLADAICCNLLSEPPLLARRPR